MAGRGGEEAFRIIDDELRDPANNHCAECGGESTHVNLTLGIFVCSVCAGIHADMNRRVRNLRQDHISVEDAMRLVDIGNARSRMKWMAKYNPRDYEEPEPSTSKESIKEFIWLKYEGNWEGDPATYDMRYDRFPSVRLPRRNSDFPAPDFWRPPKTASRTKKSSKKKKRSKSDSTSESEEEGVVIMTQQGPVSVSRSAAVLGQVAQAQQAQQMQQMQQAQLQMQQMQQMQQLQQWQAQQAYASVNPNATNPMVPPGQHGQPLNRSSSSQRGYENKDPSNPFDHL
ncbi:hypothetical protein NDN08_003156 [Rhodosorus marinus]|uniref:Arf-GAP domain-containing protein n=1 Tax=Rhodosorus marinus TaxID=101924 RepID=A0AAV8UVP9_9RHOD|nr:hypothetical protein NDN08_003156 [Rhodosorus marinus]